MNIFSCATKKTIAEYRNSTLGVQLCGEKPFGSRHWEYPWVVEQSSILESKGLKILDVAPDMTFPYSHFIRSLGHHVTFIDMERRRWSDDVVWGANSESLEDNFHIMDVRHMSFPEDSFDCIFCISVLEHVVCPTQNPDDPRLDELFDPLGARRAISEMRRCLATGGKLLITVDIYGGPKWEKHFLKWDIFEDLNSTGFTFENKAGFDREKMFKDSGTFISDFHGPYITLGFRLEK